MTTAVDGLRCTADDGARRSAVRDVVGRNAGVRVVATDVGRGGAVFTVAVRCGTVMGKAAVLGWWCFGWMQFVRGSRGWINLSKTRTGEYARSRAHERTYLHIQMYIYTHTFVRVRALVLIQPENH